MQRSISQLNPQPEFIMLTAINLNLIMMCLMKLLLKEMGKYLNIAAASVLAKTYRDAYMEKIHDEFPMYNWKQNKGYPTKEHREAIRKYGATKYHRKSFRLLPEQLTLDI